MIPTLALLDRDKTMLPGPSVTVPCPNLAESNIYLKAGRPDVCRVGEMVDMPLTAWAEGHAVGTELLQYLDLNSTVVSVRLISETPVPQGRRRTISSRVQPSTYEGGDPVTDTMVLATTAISHDRGSERSSGVGASLRILFRRTGRFTVDMRLFGASIADSPFIINVVPNTASPKATLIESPRDYPDVCTGFHTFDGEEVRGLQRPKPTNRLVIGLYDDYGEMVTVGGHNVSAQGVNGVVVKGVDDLHNGAYAITYTVEVSAERIQSFLRDKHSQEDEGFPEDQIASNAIPKFKDECDVKRTSPAPGAACATSDQAIRRPKLYVRLNGAPVHRCGPLHLTVSNLGTLAENYEAEEKKREAATPWGKLKSLDVRAALSSEAKSDVFKQTIADALSPDVLEGAGFRLEVSPDLRALMDQYLKDSAATQGRSEQWLAAAELKRLFRENLNPLIAESNANRTALKIAIGRIENAVLVQNLENETSILKLRTNFLMEKKKGALGRVEQSYLSMAQNSTDAIVRIAKKITEGKFATMESAMELYLNLARHLRTLDRHDLADRVEHMVPLLIEEADLTQQKNRVARWDTKLEALSAHVRAQEEKLAALKSKPEINVMESDPTPHKAHGMSEGVQTVYDAVCALPTRLGPMVARRATGESPFGDGLPLDPRYSRLLTSLWRWPLPREIGDVRKHIASCPYLNTIICRLFDYYSGGRPEGLSWGQFRAFCHQLRLNPLLLGDEAALPWLFHKFATAGRRSRRAVFLPRRLISAAIRELAYLQQLAVAAAGSRLSVDHDRRRALRVFTLRNLVPLYKQLLSDHALPAEPLLAELRLPGGPEAALRRDGARGEGAVLPPAAVAQLLLLLDRWEGRGKSVLDLLICVELVPQIISLDAAKAAVEKYKRTAGRPAARAPASAGAVVAAPAEAVATEAVTGGENDGRVAACRQLLFTLIENAAYITPAARSKDEKVVREALKRAATLVTASLRAAL